MKNYELKKQEREKFKEGLSAFGKAAIEMPRLPHWDGVEPFDINKSEVAKWLCAQPAVMNWVYAQAVRKRVIRFDGASKTWRGNPDGLTESGEIKPRPTSGITTWKPDWPPQAQMLMCLEEDIEIPLSKWRARMAQLGHKLGYWAPIHMLKNLMARGLVVKTDAGYKLGPNPYGNAATPPAQPIPPTPPEVAEDV